MARMPRATPFLKPAMETASAELRAEIRKRLKEMSTKAMQELLIGTAPAGIKGASYSGLRGMMAHPTESWPYGTVIRLKSMSHSSGGYLMWVGNNGRVIRISDGESKVIHADDLRLYEPVPEPDL